MNSPIRYGLVGLIVLGASLAITPKILQDRLPDPSPPPAQSATPSSGMLPPDVLLRPSSPVSPCPPSPEKVISEALAAHGNKQKIPLSFFTDLIRTMEKSGAEPDAALQVAVTVAGNPNLDDLAGLTIAGSVQAYRQATGETLDQALTELAAYIERPDTSSSRVNERFGLLSPELESLIAEKASSGNQARAALLMEEALLRRFNPLLASKIFVPWSTPAPVDAQAEPPKPEQQTPTRRAEAPSRQATISRHIVHAAAVSYAHPRSSTRVAIRRKRA